MYSILW